MPRESTTEIRLKNVTACLNAVIPLLNEINDAFGTPFMRAIANTTLSLITGVQNVKRNKENCVQLMENIHELLYAIINLHINSETGGSLPPTTLDHIGKFTETLHKIHMFVEVQDGSKIKHFLRQNEISTLLKNCHEGLQQALDVFKTEATIFTNIAHMRETAEAVHQELLEMISTLSDGTLSDRSSSVKTIHVNRCILTPELFSSKSFSMLPSKPKIFHGREAELQDIIKILHGDLPRIAILGAGGMGKTSLARAALHHPDIATKYEHRFFITCDSAHNSVGIAALLGAHLGLPAGKDLTKPVLRSLSSSPSSLLILDNLETPWEPKESQGGVEDFLSQLTDINQLSLIITMRGAQRPTKVRWTRPFLRPLKPLTDNAALQTFVDIADDSHDIADINSLLHLTDNMPLAVDLIAHLVDAEGCSNVLSRWGVEKTTLLSGGQDKRSNLDASIALSISSSRMNFPPGAKELLSLLSILPDGLSDVELLQSKLSITDILGCKSTLLGTSLAYIDDNKRLKSLVPIREHVLQFQPPSNHLIEPLWKHFHLLLDLFQTYSGQMQMASRINQITSNMGNLQQILRRGLHPDSPDLTQAIESTILLNSFSRRSGRGCLDLMDIIPAILPQPSNHRLEAQYLTEILNSGTLHSVPTPQVVVDQAISHFQNFNDLTLESKFHMATGNYYYYSKKNPSTAMQFLTRALTLARESGNTNLQAKTLHNIASLKWGLGDYLASCAVAREGQRLAQVSADWHLESEGLGIEAKCWCDLGDYKQSGALLNRAGELLKLGGLDEGLLVYNIMISAAENHSLKSEYGQARRFHSHMLQTPSAEQNPYIYAVSLVNIASIDVMTGASKHDVQQNLNKAELIFRTIERPLQILSCQATLADLHLREKDIVVAKNLFQQCLNSCWGKNTQAVSYCLERLANTSQWEVTDFNWSFKWTVVYLANSKSAHKKLDLYKALQFLGDAFLCTGDEDTANNLFVVALDGFTFMDVHRSRANCMIQLGDLAQRQGHLDEAVQLWHTARPLFELSLQMKDVVQIDARLRAVDVANQKALARLATLNVATDSFETLSAVEETGAEEEGKLIQDIKKNVSAVTI
ncbi:hypothetical protein FB451DRAFT_1164401 [Mycena latifolia]|nr:hypothetical protein FB451DRAFT_1164401 [Mycena latifolia]